LKIKKNTMKKISLILVISLAVSSCVTIKPGEVGLKQRLGKLSNEIYPQGPVFFNPFTSKIVRTSIQTRNLELTLNLPSKEGLSIMSQISILYRLEKNEVVKIVNDLGLNSESIIANVFRSASADVCSQYFAKDMHSGKRSEIETDILKKMAGNLLAKGIVIESVLMKSIQLPQGLSQSIENKLQAEQDAMRMEFVLQQEKFEAERKIIEAKGTRDAQKILSEGLTNEIIKLRSIDAFKELSNSPNAKIIVTDGKTPFLINQ
jgi:regulator of protease activity HflC (stomatin/prohibitin superfamily)